VGDDFRRIAVVCLGLTEEHYAEDLPQKANCFLDLFVEDSFDVLPKSEDEINPADICKSLAQSFDLVIQDLEFILNDKGLIVLTLHQVLVVFLVAEAVH
jgi:hypothetical protein